MAKHRIRRSVNLNYAHAAIGAAVFAASFGGAHAAQADTPSPAPGPGPSILEKAAEINGGKKAEEKPVPRPTPTASSVLELAKQQIGTTENSSGGGTKFHKWYMDSPRAQETIKRDGGSKQGYANAAWCAMFISWVGEQSGARSQVGWDAYTVTHAKWFKNNKRWGGDAKPGAVVFFSWKGSKSLDGIQHVGFVLKDNGNGSITTIEGNTGNGKVEQRVRPKSQVVGYGYPTYGA